MASCWETEPTSRPEAGDLVTRLAGYISRWVTGQVLAPTLLYCCWLVQGRPEEL